MYAMGMEWKWKTKKNEEAMDERGPGQDLKRYWAFETRTVGNKIERNNSEAGDEVKVDGGQKKESGKAGGQDGGSGNNPGLKKENRESDGGENAIQRGRYVENRRSSTRRENVVGEFVGIVDMMVDIDLRVVRDHLRVVPLDVVHHLPPVVDFVLFRFPSCLLF